MSYGIGFVGSGARGRFVGCVWLVGSLLTVSSARGAVVGFEDSPLAPESAYYGADGAGGFTTVPMRNSGLYLTGQVRDMVAFNYGNKQGVIIVAKNDDRIQVYEIMK